VRALLQSGITLMYLGQPEAAVPYIEKSLQLNPAYQNWFYRYFWSGCCRLLLGEADMAIDDLRKARAANPRLWGTHLLLAAAHGLRDDVDEAKSALAESIKLRPEIGSIARVRATAQPWEHHPQFVALRERTIFAGLRRAGLAEG
jgi:tetratricopeptide (TPR) repeat protein